MPTGIIPSCAQVEKVAAPGEWHNKNLVYVSGVKNTRTFLKWSHKKSSKLVAQIKGEYPVLVSETDEGFWAAINTFRSLGEGKGVSFHTISLLEDQCVCLLLKNLGKRIPEAEIREELEVLHIYEQTIMQLRSQ
jgi:hypothetical protein